MAFNRLSKIPKKFGQLAVPGLGTAMLHISWGGGMVRAWHVTHGLVLELPAVVAVQTSTGEPVAFFEEAAALEGKAPEGVECLRPWWADSITDRTALRALASQFRERLQESLQKLGEKTPRVTQHLSQASWRVPPTTNELHRRWLERTLTEAGWWWPKVQRANYSTLGLGVPASAMNSPQLIILDWGASALRWSVWVEGRLVLAEARPKLGWAEVADELVTTEQAITQRVFSQASLLDLHWSIRHPAFDRKHHQPVFEPLSKTTLQHVQEAWLQAYLTAWQDFQDRLPAESAAQLSVSSCFAIGGGASLKEWIDLAGEHTHIEWQTVKDPLYVEVRGGAF